MVLVRSVSVCLARANPACLCGLALALAWPILAPALAAGISSRGARHSGDLYEVALWGILLGSAAGLIAAGKLRTALASAPSTLRVSIVSATIVAPAAIASALVVLTFHMLPGLEAPLVAWSAFVPALAVSILHVAAMGLTIHSAPIPPSVRPMFLIATTCALPALAPTAFAPIALLRVAELPFPTPITDEWAASALEFVPILAWLAAALLLQVHSNRRA